MAIAAQNTTVQTTSLQFGTAPARLSRRPGSAAGPVRSYPTRTIMRDDDIDTFRVIQDCGWHHQYCRRGDWVLGFTLGRNAEGLWWIRVRIKQQGALFEFDELAAHNLTEQDLLDGFGEQTDHAVMFKLRYM